MEIAQFGMPHACRVKVGARLFDHSPLCNAWLTLLNGIGINAERHGDSTGVIKELIA